MQGFLLLRPALYYAYVFWRTVKRERRIQYFTVNEILFSSSSQEWDFPESQLQLNKELDIFQ